MDRKKEKWPIWYEYDPSFPMLLEVNKWFLFSGFDNLDMVWFLDKTKVNLIFLSLTEKKIFTIQSYMF